MYARVTIIQAQPAKLEQMARFFQKCIVPAGQKEPGFEGVLLLTHETAGKAISITFWRTEREMCAFETDCPAQLAGDFARFLEAPPVVESYDVRLQAEALPPRSIFQFAETVLGVRIENPCEEELNRTFDH
jgi:heme-degrading monooxygenase HmoA